MGLVDFSRSDSNLPTTACMSTHDLATEHGLWATGLYVTRLYGGHAPSPDATKHPKFSRSHSLRSLSGGNLLVGVVPAPSTDTRPVFQSSSFCLFVHDDESLFYIIAGFLYHSNLAWCFKTDVSVVWQILNRACFTQTKNGIVSRFSHPVLYCIYHGHIDWAF